MKELAIFFKKLECDNCLKEFDLFMDGKGEVSEAEFLCSECYIKKLEDWKKKNKYEN